MEESVGVETEILHENSGNQKSTFKLSQPLRANSKEGSLKAFDGVNSGSLSDVLNSATTPSLSRSYGLTNSLISLLLLAIAVLCMYLIFSDQQSSQEVFCVVTGPERRENLQCAFKYSCFFMSVVLLLPYLLEAVLSAELFIGGRAVPEKVFGIIKKTTESTALETMTFGLKNLIYLLYAIVASVLLLPFVCVSKQIQDSWKAIPYVVPSLLLNLALFPLAYVVIFSSQSIAETFVNLVAVQIFAGLSDVFVSQIFRPEQAIASTLTLYFPTVNFRTEMENMEETPV